MQWTKKTKCIITAVAVCVCHLQYTSAWTAQDVLCSVTWNRPIPVGSVHSGTWLYNRFSLYYFNSNWISVMDWRPVQGASCLGMPESAGTGCSPPPPLQGLSGTRCMDGFLLLFEWAEHRLLKFWGQWDFHHQRCYLVVDKELSYPAKYNNHGPVSHKIFYF